MKLQTYTPFEASSRSENQKGWTRVHYGPNTVLDDSAIIIARAQDAVRNNPWIRRAIKLLVSHQIGTGMRPIPLIADVGLRKEIVNLWEACSDEIDSDGVNDFYAMQSLIANAFYESGEVFIRMRNRYETDGLIVPFQLQVLERFFVPLDKNGTNGKNKIRQGIEITPFGKRVAYYCYSDHPSEYGLYAGYRNNELQKVDANKMLHHYLVERPGQLRGLSHVVSALLRARNFDAYEYAELARKKSRASLVGAIYRENDDVNPLTDDPITIKKAMDNRQAQRRRRWRYPRRYRSSTGFN